MFKKSVLVKIALETAALLKMKTLMHFQELDYRFTKVFFFIENLQWLLLQIILSDDVLGKNIFLKTFPHLILGSLILLENEQERVSAISTDLWTSYFVACLPLTAFDTQKCHNKL